MLFTANERRHRIGTCMTAAAVAAILLAAPSAAKPEDPITVTIGEPSLWTLEQAHYLLARMHATNQKLETRFPTSEELDPNRIHGSQFELLRSVAGHRLLPR